MIFRRGVDGEKIVSYPLTADGVYRKTFGAPTTGSTAARCRKS